MFGRIETISNHGTGQGVFPRFFNQMKELWEMAFGANSNYAQNQTEYYFNNTIHEITAFYDIYTEILEMHDEYIEGLNNGKYYIKNERGHVTLDRKVELKMRERIKDFFIKGRIIFTQLIKSELIKDQYLDLNKFLLVSPKNFSKNWQEYTDNDPQERYYYIIKLIDRGRKQFLNDFSEYRNQIEHRTFNLDKHEIIEENGRLIIKQPKLNGLPLIRGLEFFFENIFDLAEKIIVYYYGINAFINSKGRNIVHVRQDFDYSQLKYRYNIHLGNMPWYYPSKRMKYE